MCLQSINIVRGRSINHFYLTVNNIEKVQPERKGVGGYASSIKLNLTARTMVEGFQAGGLGYLLQYMREYNAESSKHDRKGFNSIVKTIYFSYLPIIYLQYGK